MVELSQMRLVPQRLAFGLSFCLCSFAIMIVTILLAAADLIYASDDLLLIVFGFSVMLLFPGLAFCAASVSGPPLIWAALAFILGATSLHLAIDASPGVGGEVILLAVAASFCVCGMILSLGRRYGDPTTKSLSKRAFYTSVLAPLVFLLLGNLLEPHAGLFGLSQIFLGLAIICGPLLLTGYTVYLTVRLILTVKKLNDGDVPEVPPEAPDL